MTLEHVRWDKAAPAADGPPDRRENGKPARAALAGPTLLVLLGLSNFAFAAPPKLNNFYPAGCQRGQTVAVTAAGDFPTWPVDCWVDRRGVWLTAE